MGYQISLAIEENVTKGEIGSRKTLTIYAFGDAQIHNGGLITNTENRGIELTYDIFYKVNDYFIPSIGLGAGINRQAIDYEARSTTFGGGH